MNEHEMLIALKAYINGVIGGQKYVCTFNVEAYREFEKDLEKMTEEK